MFINNLKFLIARAHISPYIPPIKSHRMWMTSNKFVFLYNYFFLNILCYVKSRSLGALAGWCTTGVRVGTAIRCVGAPIPAHTPFGYQHHPIEHWTYFSLSFSSAAPFPLLCRASNGPSSPTGSGWGGRGPSGGIRTSRSMWPPLPTRWATPPKSGSTRSVSAPRFFARRSGVRQGSVSSSSAPANRAA